MPVLVVHFLKAVQIEYHQRELLAVAPRSCQLFLERFAEEPAIVKTRERIGHGVELQSFQLVVFEHDGNMQQISGGENIHQGSLQRDGPAEKTSLMDVLSSGNLRSEEHT